MKKSLLVILFALSGQLLFSAASSKRSKSRGSKERGVSVTSLRRAGKIKVIWKCCDEYHRLHKDGKSEQVPMTYFKQAGFGWVIYNAQNQTCTIGLRDLGLSNLHGLSKLLRDFSIYDEEVTQIRLDNNCLGELPKKLSRFTSLTHLFLEGNPDVVLPWSLGPSKRIRYLRMDKDVRKESPNYELLVRYANRLRVLK